MPEMPEVEIMVRRLQRAVGYDIATADGRGGARYLPGNEKAFVIDQTIKGVFRRGKFIVFMLERGAILAHNAMSGYWDFEDERWSFDYVEGKRKSLDTDIRCCFLLAKRGEVLSETGVNLLFHDTRKFGFLKYYEPDELAKKLSKLGPEAAESAHMYEPTEVMNKDRFTKMLKLSSKTIKEVLMDQNKIAGLGNIYVAEALHSAGIRPTRIAKELTHDERNKLYDVIPTTLHQALARHLNYDSLKIYRRDRCPDCLAPTKNERIKGRSTYWCPSCQT